MKQKETQTLAELVPAARAGDTCAQSELYTHYYNTVYYTAATVVKDEEAALDIVQDSFLKAFTQLETLSNPEAFPAWIKRIATNNARNWLRKRNPLLFSQIAETDEEGNEMPVEIEDLDLTRQPEEMLDAKTKKELLWAIIDTLSDEQRLVVNMFYFQGVSVADIAQELAVSQNTVKSRLNYARKKIEIKVLDLEKQGTKLYGMAPVAFFVWLFLQNQQVNPVLPVALSGAAPAGSAAAGTAGKSGAAAATAETSAAGAAAGGAALAAGTAIKAAGAVAAKGVAAKIVAGAAAVVLVGGTAAGVAYVKPWQAAQPAAETSVQAEVSPAPEEVAAVETPTATEVPTPAPEAIPLTGLHAAAEYQNAQDAYYYVDDDILYCIDYATAQRTALLDVGSVPNRIYASIGDGEAYITTAGNTAEEPSYVYVYSLEDGSLLRTMQVDFGYHFDYFDEQYGYCFEWDDVGAALGYQVDLQTGVGTEIALPEGMSRILGTADDRFVICRVLDGVDLHQYNNPEEYMKNPEAIIQKLSAVNMEVDWWDPATGTLQPILQEPYYGSDYATTGSRTTRYFEGEAGDTLYFGLSNDQGLAFRYETCGMDGSGRTILPLQVESNPLTYTDVLQNGELHWLVFNTATGAVVYDVATGTQYSLGVDYYEVPQICALTADGQVLLLSRSGSDSEYRLMSQDDFLAGNFTGTVVQDAA